MPSSVASHTPAMPDVPNAINALLRHVPNPFLLRRKVTTCSYMFVISFPLPETSFSA
jgi:hypothetical protein